MVSRRQIWTGSASSWNEALAVARYLETSHPRLPHRRNTEPLGSVMALFTGPNRPFSPSTHHRKPIRSHSKYFPLFKGRVSIHENLVYVFLKWVVWSTARLHTTVFLIMERILFVLKCVVGRPRFLTHSGAAPFSHKDCLN